MSKPFSLEATVAQNFLPCERDQELLLPRSPREWLPEDHLAWFVLDAVEQLDLTASTPPTGPTAGAGAPSSQR
jgi:hypothetical protein